MVDWQKLRIEYITNETSSYRKLAEKYGIHYKVISDRGKDEKWVEQRSQYRAETLTKTLDKISRQEANRAARIHSVADKLLRKIEAMVDSGELISEKGIRSLTAAVKDLKEIQGVKSELDKQEQQARIDNLRRQAEQSNTGGSEPVTVQLEGVEEYAQ